jgi:hypothetical protein
LNKFCVQLNEFCLMFQEQILLLEKAPAKSPSADLALAFAESLILCPTGEAARVCIRRDLPGARSFLVAADSVLRRIRSQQFQFSLKEPQYQTRFYLLSCAIEEFLKTRQTVEPAELEPSCTAV